MTTKLSDAQLVVLSAACQRPDRNVLPLPERMKGGAAQKIVASLIGKGLIEEVAGGPNDPVWRESDDGGRTKLRTTDAALQTLGIKPEEGVEDQPAEDSVLTPPAVDQQADTPAQAARAGGQANDRADEPAKPEAQLTTPAAGSVRKSRPDTKQAQLVVMLKQPGGASLDEIVAATGWQAHTVRGAIAGALKTKLGLAVTSESIEGRGRVYRTPG